MERERERAGLYDSLLGCAGTWSRWVGGVVIAFGMVILALLIWLAREVFTAVGERQQMVL